MYTSLITLSSLILGAHAAIHELIIGTFSTKSLYTVEFDDEALTLNLIANTSVPYAGNWIAFNVHMLPLTPSHPLPPFLKHTSR
jgi:carboxy-cis,cis-muconate cyclase